MNKVINIDIDVFVSKKGHVVFACHGQFEKQISQIVLNTNNGDVSFLFKPDLEVKKTNCSLSLELCKKVQNQLFCAVGYFEGKKLVASEYIRFTCRAL